MITRSRTLLIIMLSALSQGCVAPKTLTADTPESAEKQPPALTLYEGSWDKSVAMAQAAGTASEAERLADRAWQAKDMNSAAAFYARALELDKKNASAGHKLARLHLQAGNTGQAEQIYRFVLKNAPRHIASLEGAGLVLLKQNNIKEARRLLVKAVALFQNQGADGQSPIPVAAFDGLGQLADRDGDHGKAQAYYQQGLRLAPRSPALLNNMAYSLYLSGALQKAKPLLQDALAIDPDFTRAAYNLALVNIRLRDYDTALTLFGRYMEPYEASNDVGYLAMLAGDEDRAEALFQQAIDTAPAYHEAAWRNMDKLKQLKARRQGGGWQP